MLAGSSRLGDTDYKVIYNNKGKTVFRLNFDKNFPSIRCTVDGNFNVTIIIV